MKHGWKIALCVAMSIIVTLAIIHLSSPNHIAKALSGFSSGKVIDDATMQKTTYNSVADVQNFLNNNGGQCSISICLRNYNEGGQSAATIISNAAAVNGLNAQVLLTLLELENKLVTDTSPSQSQFDNAMGYGGVAGFTNQLNQAAKFISEIMTGTPSTYQINTPSTLPWNVDTNCGTTQVTIETLSTAALYSYSGLGYATNSAALSGDTSQGDGCSSYGIRNFYIYYSQWFGSPVTGTLSPSAKYVYRFGNMPDNTHFWTTDSYERDSMISAGYRYENTGWRVSSTPTPYPVYRLYNRSIRQHLFTADSWEVHILTTSSGWTSEGVAWYTSSDPQGAPVYRLYSPTTHEHFFTTDQNERSILISTHVFSDEGVAWKQPVVY